MGKTFLKRKVYDFNIFFCCLANTLVFVQSSRVFSFTLSSEVFFLNNVSTVTGRMFVLKFLRNTFDFWKIFWSIVSVNHALRFGFFTEMELIGLGFRIKKIIPTIFRFFWGYANYTYLFVPNDVFVEYESDERMIFFFSVNPLSINNLSSYLMLLKKLSVYRVTGFVRPGRIIRLNSGKQR